MEIVIDIDDGLYNRIKYLEPKADTMLDKLMRSIQNGTPLPKGHGNLKDTDAINHELMDEYYGMISDSEMKIYKIMRMLDNAHTIIETDKGSESE